MKKMMMQRVDTSKSITKSSSNLKKAKSGTNISCWKGYTKKGTKTLKGKTVNNCVKKK